MKIAVLYSFEPNDVMYHQFLTRSLMLMVLIWEKFVQFEAPFTALLPLARMRQGRQIFWPEVYVNISRSRPRRENTGKKSILGLNILPSLRNNSTSSAGEFPMVPTIRKQAQATSFSKHMRLGRDIGFAICEAPKHVAPCDQEFSQQKLQKYLSVDSFSFFLNEVHKLIKI